MGDDVVFFFIFYFLVGCNFGNCYSCGYGYGVFDEDNSDCI